MLKQAITFTFATAAVSTSQISQEIEPAANIADQNISYSTAIDNAPIDSLNDNKSFFPFVIEAVDDMEVDLGLSVDDVKNAMIEEVDQNININQAPSPIVFMTNNQENQIETENLDMKTINNNQSAIINLEGMLIRNPSDDSLIGKRRYIS